MISVFWWFLMISCGFLRFLMAQAPKSKSFTSWSRRPLLNGMAYCQAPGLCRHAPRAEQKLIISAWRSSSQSSCRKNRQSVTSAACLVFNCETKQKVRWKVRLYAQSWNRNTACNHCPAWSQAPSTALYANKLPGNGISSQTTESDWWSSWTAGQEHSTVRLKSEMTGEVNPMTNKWESRTESERARERERVRVLHICQQLKCMLPMSAARSNARCEHQFET